MSAASISGRLGVGRSSGRSLAWWGMTLTILTEGMLFGLLVFVYFYLYSVADEWPLGGIEPPELLRISIRTAVLLASSATMSIAERAMRRGRTGWTATFLAATFGLGGAFLAGHVLEMVRLVEEFTWSTNVYGSLFYVIVNFHGLHLAVGLVMLLMTGVALRRGRFSAERHDGFTVAGMYWHFVDVVWVFVFPTLYLVPHLMGK